MQAVRFHQHGDVDVLTLEQAPEPKAGPNDVIVQVKACALNHLDVWVRQGLPGIPLPHILGCDIAGIVESVGSEVTGVETGSKVLVSPGLSCGRCMACLSGNDNLCASYDIVGQRADGGYAEYVKVPAVNILPMPENLSFEEAAAAPLVFLTVWHMLVARAHLQQGEDVLVQAAGSGVGSAAIQVAKLFNARVIATASTDEKLEKAKALGADHVINYTTSDFTRELRNIVGRKGVEVVVEHVGGTVFEQSIRALGTNGRLVTCGATAAPEITLDLRFVFSRHLNILGSWMGSKADLLQVLKFVSTGQLKPVVHAVLPLSEARQAHQLILDRANFGKIVLTP